jgi:membrane protein YqaA with SNARE-associated domain
MDDPISPETQREEEKKDAAPRKPAAWFRVLLPLGAALCLSLFVTLLFTKYQDQIEALKGYGYLGAFIIGFLSNATVIVPAPSLAFTAALGGILNPVLVGVAAGAGEALGELTGYLAGLSGNAVIENRPQYETMRSYMERYGGWFFFVLALIPNPFFDIAGIAAGVVRFPVWLFLLSTWVGKTVKAIVLAGAGRQFLSDCGPCFPPWNTRT